MSRRISPALVLSVLAIVLATTAGATAASSLITGKQIRDHSLTGADIKHQSVGADAIADGAITADKLSGALASAIAAPGVPGAAGAAGPAGPRGATGPAGPAGSSDVRTIISVSGSGTMLAGAVGTGSMPCPPGQRVIGGGWSSDHGYATMSRPTSDNKGWVISIDNTGSAVDANVTIYASCADVGQVVAAPRTMGGLR